MTRWRDRSSWDLEVHRLKNRLRQQRYRARKRERKSRSVGETPLLADLFISSVPNVTNGLGMLRHDVGPINPKSIRAENEINSADSVQEAKVCSAIDTGATECAVTQLEEQQFSVEPLGTYVEGGGSSSLGECQTIGSESNKLRQQSLIEHGCTVNLPKMQSSYEMPPLDHREHSRLMARRLKNRERQRRYRARKRLEADMKKAHFTNQSSSLEPIPNAVITKYTNRVHCLRKWKEDARRAHPPKEPELKSPESQLPTRSEDQVNVPPSDVKVELLEGNNCQSAPAVSLTNCETDGTAHGRRDWKTDARNKMD